MSSEPIRSTHELARALLARRDNDFVLGIRDRDGEVLAVSETVTGVTVDYMSRQDYLTITGEAIMGDVIDTDGQVRYVESGDSVPSEKFTIAQVLVVGEMERTPSGMHRVELSVVLERMPDAD